MLFIRRNYIAIKSGLSNVGKTMLGRKNLLFYRILLKTALYNYKKMKFNEFKGTTYTNYSLSIWIEINFIDIAKTRLKWVPLTTDFIASTCTCAR